MDVIQNHYSSAEFLMQSAEKHLKTPHDDTTSPKWRSLYTKLQEVMGDKNSSEDDEEGPVFKRCRLATNPLWEFCNKNKDLSRLIVNLFPLDNGYSLMFKTSSGQCIETKALPYEEYEILDHIDNQEIPPSLVGAIENLDSSMFHDGCIIAEIRDYRISSGPDFYDTKYVLLRPTHQTLLGDVRSIVEETSHVYQWTNDDKLALESCLLLSTSEPLCLDPSPTVGIIKNIADRKGKFFNTKPLRRCMKRNGMNAMRRMREMRKRSAPPALKLFDFLKRRKEKKDDKVASSSTTDIRLPKHVTDLWHKDPVDQSHPTGGIGVHNSVKALSRQPPTITDTDMLEVQLIHLKSEGQNRDVYSHITILQRPSDMQYFGKLQSNKYFQQAVETTGSTSSSCRFPLGTEHRANLYILQYQELFAEDGRRPATVTVSRPLQPSTKYQIPLLQQPWQLEQDKSLYAVGSVNNIPIKHWPKLKVNDTTTPKHQTIPTPSNQPQRPPAPQNQTSTVQLSTVSTPTLNTVTLQPGVQRTQQQQQSSTSALNQQQQTIQPSNSAPTLTRLLGPRLSGETLIAGIGSLYQIKENTPDIGGRDSKVQDSFTIVSQPGTHDSGNLTSMTCGTTPLLLEDHNQNNNSGNMNLQLPLTIATQPQSGVTQHVPAKLVPPATQQHVSIQPHHAGQTTVLRLPASIASVGGSVSTPSGNQQMTTINLVSGDRNVLNSSSSIQQIQLTPGSRPGTVTIPANIAMQLAAQFNQDKSAGVSGNPQSITLGAVNTSSPITIVTNAGAAQSSQPQQFRTISGNHPTNQLLQYVDGNQNKPTTITINQRTQMVNLRNNQQPVQIVQVGAASNIQPIALRNQGQPQQFLLRSTTPDLGNQQGALAQQLQQLTNSVAASNGKQGRSRKRKITPDKNK